jgi:hypothetical protein
VNRIKTQRHPRQRHDKIHNKKPHNQRFTSHSVPPFGETIIPKYNPYVKSRHLATTQHQPNGKERDEVNAQALVVGAVVGTNPTGVKAGFNSEFHGDAANGLAVR